MEHRAHRGGGRTSAVLRKWTILSPHPRRRKCFILSDFCGQVGVVCPQSFRSEHPGAHCRRNSTLELFRQ